MNPNLELRGKEASSQVGLSPFETVVAFDPVRPLARVPVPAGQGDEQSKGGHSYVLAFRDEDAWRRAWRTCKEKIETQCQAGAKLGCSISAAKACGRPWWKPPSLPFLPNSGDDDQSKREECEAREMRGCLVSAQERCAMYARETCDPVYANMRIVAPGAPIDRRFNGQPLQRPRVTRHDKLEAPKPNDPTGVHRPESADATDEERPRLGVTTFRGRLLMQHEPREDWERMPNWSTSQGLATHNPTAVQQESFPKEGWVGGLVHPAPKKGPAQMEEGRPIPKGPICTALDLWQKLQQSVMERFAPS